MNWVLEVGMRVEDLRRQHPLLRSILHVHDRRLTRHDDGFLDRADRQLHVHGGGERPGQLDAVALDGTETDSVNVTA